MLRPSGTEKLNLKILLSKDNGRFTFMMSRFLRVWLPFLSFALVLFWSVGCSGSPSISSPTLPELGNSAQGESSSSGHYLWGEYLITVRDIEDASGKVTGVDIQIAPLRTSQKHFDVTSFVQPPSCSDCVKVIPVNYVPGDPWSEITATVFLRNPKPITGYDIRGIVYPPSDQAMLKNRFGYTTHDGLTTLYNAGMPELANPYMAFNKTTMFRPFEGYAEYGASYVFLKKNAYKLLTMVYKIDASFPGNAQEPVDAFIPPLTEDDHIYPEGSNAIILAVITDWQDNVASVTLNLSSLGVPTPAQMIKVSEDTVKHTSLWQYHLTHGAGYPAGLRTVRLTATDSVDSLVYMKEFEIEVTYDSDPPTWLDPSKKGIYDHIGSPNIMWLFFHEAWDISLPLYYIFYGNDKSSPFDGSVLKVVSSDNYVGYTPFDVTEGKKVYYGIRLQDAQGWQDDNMEEYIATSYLITPRWTFIKGQPPGSDGIFGAPAIGDVNGDGKKDIVVGTRDNKVYVYGGSGTGNQDTVIWEFATGGEIQCVPALVDLNGDGKLDVVVASDDTNIYAINGATGLELWHYDAGDGILMHGSPAITQLNGGAYDVVIGTGGGTVLALNGENGSKIWEYQAGGGIAGTPGLADVTGDGIADVCVGAYDTKVHMINGATGKAIWTYYLGPGMNNIDNSPVMVDISGDTVPDCIIGGRVGGDGIIFALDGASPGPTANELWVRGGLWGNARRPAAPAKINGDNIWDFVLTLYQAEEWSFYAIDGLTGAIIYQRLGPDIDPDTYFNYSAPLVGDFTGDGHLNALYGRQDGFCDLVNLSNLSKVPGLVLPGPFEGMNLFKMQVSTGTKQEIYATPAIEDVDGDGEWELIVCNMRGYTYILDMHAPVPSDPALRPWTMHQGNRWNTGVPMFTPPDE